MIHIGHSPDPDDAFMFYALTFAKFDTTPEIYEHHLVDIETLNREAERGKYEVTALSFHACAYIAEKYALLPHGASFGDNYGPILVAPSNAETCSLNNQSFDAARQWLAGKIIAVPGARTSAFLGLHLFAGVDSEKRVQFQTVVVPFNQIMPQVAAGKYDGGVIIHEGQLTYCEAAHGSLQKIVDIGEWWTTRTGLPMPLGGNGIRRDLGAERIKRISTHLRQSIEWGLTHRNEALGYAARYARNINKDKIDRFVGMYVNAYTLDYGEKGRAAVRRFLEEGYKIGTIKTLPQLEWVID